MEQDPHGVLEGMALAALAAGATRGYVYVRSEYPCARDTMRRAIEEARRDGHLGMGFDVEVFEGAGSYVAGEETALIHSMEGLRGGTPRPPYPAARGLYGRPTVVNNVETLASIPWIVARGGDAYAEMGLGDSHGTKVVCLNERFERPGAYEVELGTTVSSIVEELGGGLKEGRPLRRAAGRRAARWLSGPASSTCRSRSGRCARPAWSWGTAAWSPSTIASRRSSCCDTCGGSPPTRAAAPAPCRVGSRRGLELAGRIAMGDATEADQKARRAARHDGRGEPVRVRPERAPAGARPAANLPRADPAGVRVQVDGRAVERRGRHRPRCAARRRRRGPRALLG